MSRLLAALNKPTVRGLGALLARASCTLALLSYGACGADEAQQPLDAGMPARTMTQPVPVTAPSQPVTSLPVAPAAPALPPVACGPNQCARPENIAADLLMKVTGLPTTGAETFACCLDQEQGVCSSTASLRSGCDVVAVSDNSCPGVDLSALADLVGGLFERTQDAMIGCCTHGACGLNGKIFGRGCVENAEAKRMLSVVPVIGPLISVPAPRACAAASDNDAGT